MNASSKIWKLGDDIDTDSLAPGRFMNASIDELAAHCLETVRLEFAAEVQPGDIIVAGSNFGVGSSREQAVEALKQLGVAAVIAKSFAGIFYRNAINLGLPVFECADTDRIADRSTASLDVETGKLGVGELGIIDCTPMPAFLKAIVDDGGLVPHLEKRFAAEAGT